MGTKTVSPNHDTPTTDDFQNQESAHALEQFNLHKHGKSRGKADAIQRAKQPTVHHLLEVIHPH